MSKSVLSKLSAIALIIGGLIVSYSHFFPFTDPRNAQEIGAFLSHLNVLTPIVIGATFLVLLGFVGLYGKHYSKIGWAGFIGFIFLFVFIALMQLTPYIVGHSVSSAVYEGVTTEEAFREANVLIENAFGALFGYFFIILVPLGLIGGFTFGISIIRSNATAKWPAYILLGSYVSVITLFTGINLGPLGSKGAFFLSLAAFGIAQFMEKKNTA